MQFDFPNNDLIIFDNKTWSRKIIFNTNYVHTREMYKLHSHQSRAATYL